MTNNLQGTIELLILKTLEHGPNHGFGITLHIQGVSGGLLKVEEGSLYPALHRLDRDKLVEAEWKVSENGRRARYYKLTAQGRKTLVAQTETWDTLRRGVTKVLRFAQ
jgi:PadR family transcriptional regulator PadR